MKSFVLFVTSLMAWNLAQAQVEGFYSGATQQKASFQETTSSIKPGSVVIIGENHGLELHQRQQMAIMQALRSYGPKISVGLEFFTYTDQPLVNDYRQGILDEESFLKAIKWGSPSFDFYRQQAQFPLIIEGGQTLALNAPRSLTGKVAKTGLESLTAEEAALLPPGFTLGRDSYKQRFLSLMPHLPSPAHGDRYFAAQSIWDDTMAWVATEYMKAHPDFILVIIVGEFHVQYGGGLPNRIQARAPGLNVVTFSQVNTNGLTSEEAEAELAPSAVDGPRADYLWLAPAVQ